MKQLVKTVVAIFAGHGDRATRIAARTLLCFVAVVTTPAFAQSNPITVENEKPGTNAWQLRKPANDRGLQIKAYASETSVSSGDRLKIFVSTNPAQKFQMRVYRMGFYAGLGGRLVYQSPWKQAARQEQCPMDSSTGFTRCSWSQTISLAIPDDWTTGVYLAKFVNNRGFDNYLLFTVKDDSRIPDFYYQQPVTTYQAYNAFPDDGIRGKNSYDKFSAGPPTLAGSARAVKLSFQRPMENTGAERFFRHEHDLIMFLEERGYDVSYRTNIDIHQSPRRISRAKGFISPGHDEYWTRENFDAVKRARDNGVNLAFFGANTAYYQIRLVDDPVSGRNRAMEIYKNRTLDPEPVFAKKTITRRALGRPEQTLTGVQFVADGPRSSDTDFIARNTRHWIYRGSGLLDGDRIRGIVGLEVDQRFPDQAGPDSQRFSVIGRSPFVSPKFPNPVISQAVVYRAPSDAWVFASGTLLWGQGLNRPGLRSRPLRRMTKNLLDRYAGINGEDPVTISIKSLRVRESRRRAKVEVRLSAPSNSPVEFGFATRPFTARRGIDYFGLYRNVVIPAGDTSAIIPITIIQDDEAEESEKLFVRIFDVKGARVIRPQVPVTIVDSPQTPGLRVVSTSVRESTKRALVAVTLQPPAATRIKVNYETRGRTAKQGLDYVTKRGVLIFEPGDSVKYISIRVRDDKRRESIEWLNVRLFQPVRAKIAQSSARLTIRDND